ncbi:MAG: LysR family transcriptional regulator [Burkholderiales bacterium]
MDLLAAMNLYLRVVETGSFSRAATDAGMTQPTVSKSIAALERHLGARLLNRTTRALTPTEAGAGYYQHCKRVQEELEAAANAVSQTGAAPRGRLRVASSVAFGRQILTPMVLEFAQKHPAIRIDLSFDDGFVDLIAQNIDVAVRMGALADSSLGARRLGQVPWVLVASPAYLERHAAPVAPADLKQHNCLVYSSVQGDDVWHMQGVGGEKHQVAIRGSLRANNLSAVRAAVLAGMGVAILPRYVVRQDLDSGTVVPLLARYALPAQEIHALYASPRFVPERTRVFVEFLTRAFADPQLGLALPTSARKRS